MYRILVKAGTRPADSKVTIDGIGELTVGHWHVVDDRQAEMFRIMHPSGLQPTLLQAFEGVEDIEVETYKPPVAPVVTKPAEAPSDGSNKKQEEVK